MPWRCLARLDMTYFFGSEAKDLLNQTAHRYPKEILRFAQDDGIYSISTLTILETPGSRMVIPMS